MQSGIDALGEHMAGEIGEAWDVTNPEAFDHAMRYLSHAAAGCIIGAATAEVNNSETESGCAAGASGAVIGELVADVYRNNNEQYLQAKADVDTFLAESHAEITSSILSNKTDAQIIAELSSGEHFYNMTTKLKTLSAAGVDLAKLGAGLAVLIAGADAEAINIAAAAGDNAARNNSLRLRLHNRMLEAIELLRSEFAKSDFYLEFIKNYKTNQNSISVNSLTYSNYDFELRYSNGVNIQTDWFALASLVTSFPYGLGALDLPLSSLVFLSLEHDSALFIASSSEELLSFVSFSLANENQDTFEKLNSGQEIQGYEGLRGNELDLALVDKEQALVTQFMEQYFLGNPIAEPYRSEIMQQISYNFNPESVLYSANLTSIQHAIKAEFSDKGEIMNMALEEHRVRLGYRLVNDLNDERENLVGNPE